MIRVIAPLVVVLIGLAAWFGGAFYRNLRVPAGYAGYVWQEPIVRPARFIKVVQGPGGTGFMYRPEMQLVQTAPVTVTEVFDRADGLVSRDNLLITGQAHIVWRIHPDQVDIFMQQYGGVDIVWDPGKLLDEAYKHYVRSPFRAKVRQVASEYAGLDMNESLESMSDRVANETRERLQGTPFEVVSVVMGQTTPPGPVVEAVARKVEALQVLERTKAEKIVAEREIDVRRAQGEAAGRREVAATVGKVEAIRKISEVITDDTIRYRVVEAIAGAEKTIFLPVTPAPVLPVGGGQ